MTVAKRSDIERQIAALQAELESADTDDEVWIKDGDHEIKVSGKRATAILGRFKGLWEQESEAGASEDEDDDDQDDEDEKDAPPAGGGGYFKGRRK